MNAEDETSLNAEYLETHKFIESKEPPAHIHYGESAGKLCKQYNDEEWLILTDREFELEIADFYSSFLEKKRLDSEQLKATRLFCKRFSQSQKKTHYEHAREMLDCDGIYQGGRDKKTGKARWTGDLTLEMIAHGLCVSDRTLQRYMKNPEYRAAIQKDEKHPKKWKVLAPKVEAIRKGAMHDILEAKGTATK